MTPSLGRILLDTWALFRREADLIVSVAAPFVFLPALAVQLLADPLPPLPPAPRDQQVLQAWLDAVTSWGQGNAGWYVAADAISLFGLAALAVMLLDPARPDVGGALGGAARRFWRFALASVLVAIPVGAGMWLLILPGLYAQTRLIAAVPALAAEQPLGAGRSLARSIAITRGIGWPTLGAVVTLFLVQYLALSPLLSLDAWLRVPSHLNPFLLALIDAGLAAITSSYHVAILLIGVMLYRREARQGM